MVTFVWFFSTVGFKMLTRRAWIRTSKVTLDLSSGCFQSLPMHNCISCICFAFFTASFQMSPLSKLKWDVIKVSLVAFVSSYSMCVFICVLKVPARVDAYSHWLHLFEFSPLWSFKWVYKTTAQEDGILRWLHMFCFYPLCIFKWLFKLPVLEYA